MKHRSLPCAARVWAALTILPFLLACILQPAAASGRSSLRLCIVDLDYPPFTFPQRDGQAQQWIRNVMRDRGERVVFVARPWRRCLAETAKGRFDGVVGAAATQENSRFLAFPGGNGVADPALALGVTRMLAYRPLTSRARWDGRRFHDLSGPVLFTAGISALRDSLIARGVPYNDDARSPETVALMLLHGRSNLAIDHAERVHRLLQRSEFRGLFEVLPQPYAAAPVYVAINRDYYAAHARAIEAFWQALAAQRQAAL